jgi:ABC-2 type transport system permease protein
MSRARGIGPARVMLRTHRARILAWAVPLLALLAVVAPSYASTYPRLDQRRHLVDSLGDNAATRLLYGPLPNPGTIGQLVAWEMGTYLIIASSVMALLLGAGFVRGAEDSGIAELVQASGHPAADRLRGGLLAVSVVTGGLGLAVATVQLVEVPFVDELTWRGAVGLGLVTGCCSLCFGLVGLLAGEVADSAALAKLLGLLVLGAAFAVRAVANVHGVTRLRWVSPLGWRDVEAPYSSDRMWSVLVFLAICAGLSAAVWLTGRGREYAAAPLHEDTTSADRLPVRSVFALTWHLERRRWVSWTVGVSALTALFGGMSGSLVDLLRGDSSTAKLMNELTGEHRLDAAFFSFAGVVIALLVGCYAVLTISAGGADEADGLLEDLLACGVRRRDPLTARALIAAAGALAMLVVAGVVGAAVTLTQLQDGAAGRSLGYVVGQWPAVLALTGIAVLAVGVQRRWGAVAWVPVAGSAALVLMGSVLHAPHWLRVSAVFAHVPDYADGASPSVGALLLVGCFVVAAVIGTWWRGRRDLVAG